MAFIPFIPLAAAAWQALTFGAGAAGIGARAGVIAHEIHDHKRDELGLAHSSLNEVLYHVPNITSVREAALINSLVVQPLEGVMDKNGGWIDPPWNPGCIDCPELSTLSVRRSVYNAESPSEPLSEIEYIADVISTPIPIELPYPGPGGHAPRPSVKDQKLNKRTEQGHLPAGSEDPEQYIPKHHSGVSNLPAGFEDPTGNSDMKKRAEAGSASEIEVRAPVKAIFKNDKMGFSANGLISGLESKAINGIREGRIAFNLGPDFDNKTAEGKWMFVDPNEATKEQVKGFNVIRDAMGNWNGLDEDTRRVISLVMSDFGIPSLIPTASNVAHDRTSEPNSRRDLNEDEVAIKAAIMAAVRAAFDQWEELGEMTQRVMKHIMHVNGTLHGSVEATKPDDAVHPAAQLWDDVLSRSKKMDEAGLDPNLSDLSALGPLL